MSNSKPNEFAPECTEDPATGIKQIKINSKIEVLKTRFYFHDILKSSSGFSNHFIIEDLEIDPEDQDEDPDAQLFYYLKQSVYRSKPEFLYALSYYKKLHQYCQAKFAKSDIIRLHHIYNFEAENYFELAVVFDFGEPDRIDIDHIEPQHINKFLKNICVLLNDLKKFDQLYHSNIAVHNIVLVNNELKLSGFKPRFLFNPDYASWKIELARKVGYFRLDLFLIGLIWLRFLGLRQIDEIENSHAGLEKVQALVRESLSQASEPQRKEIVLKLANCPDFPDIDLDEVILDFDEYYILENIKSLEKQRQSEKAGAPLQLQSPRPNSGGPAQEFLFDSRDLQSYPSERFESEAPPIRKSDSRDTNLFMRPYRESLPNLLRAPAPENERGGLREREEFLRIEGDFTLKDENSVENFAQGQMEGEFFNLNEELIAIKDQKFEGEKKGFFAEGKNGIGGNLPGNALRLRISSEKKLGLRANDKQMTEGMRKLRSQEKLDLVTRKIEEEEEDREFAELEKFPKQNAGRGENDEEQNFEEGENLEAEFDKAIEREIAETEKVNKPDPDSLKLLDRSNESTEMQKTPSKGNIQKESSRSLKKFEEKFKYVDEFADPNDLLLKSIREKRQKLEEVKPRNLELTDEQKLKVQKEVENNLEKFFENQIVKIKKGKEDIFQKEIERKEQEKILKEKIEKKLAENLEKKKKEQKTLNKNEKVAKDSDKDKRAALSPTPEPQRALKIIKAEKESNISDSKIRLESGETVIKPAKKQNEKDSIEEMNKRLKKQFELSTHEQRKNLFAANNKQFEAEAKNLNFKKTSDIPAKFIEVVSDIKTPLVPKPPENYSDLLKDIPSDQFNTLSESGNPNKELIEPQTFGININSQANFAQGLENSQDLEKLKQQFKDSIKKENLPVQQTRNLPPTNPTQANNDRIFDEFPSLDYSSEYSTPGKQALSETEPRLPSFSLDPNLANMISGGKPNITFGQIQSNYNMPKISESDQGITEDDFNYRILVIKRLFLQQRFREALEYLEGLRSKFGVAQEIEILKLLSLIHFKMKNLPKAKETLIEALQLLRNHIDLFQAHELLKSILINIAIIDFENKDFEEVILILKNKAFEEQGTVSTGYFQLLGDAYYGVKNHREAFIAYDLELKALVSLDLSEKIINEILSISVKIVMSLFIIKETEIVAKFFKNMREILTNAEKQDEKIKPQQFVENISWNFLMRLLSLTEQINSSDLTLLLLKEFSQIEISQEGCSLPETDKETLLAIIVKTVLWLKSLPDKAVRQTNLLALILWGLDLVQTMESTDGTNRQYLVLLFNKGLFLFEEEEFEMAKDSFDLCLEVYYLSNDPPLEDLLLILFNIGVCLQKIDNFDEASFYFEKVLQNDVGQSSIMVKTTKILAQIYYRLEIFGKCQDTLKSWVLQNYKTAAKRSFFKYLYMFYHCCKLANSTDLPEATEAVKFYLAHNQQAKSSYFVHAYFNLTEEALEKGDFKESESYLQVVKSLFKSAKDNGFQKEFVSDINLMNVKFERGKFQDALLANKQLQKVMRENPAEFVGSEDTIMNFLVNFLFVILSKLPLEEEEGLQNLGERQATVEAILKFKEDRKIFDKVYELIKLQQNLMTSFISESEISLTQIEGIKYYESQTINTSNQIQQDFQRKQSQSLQEKQVSSEPRKEPSFNSKKNSEAKTGTGPKIFGIQSQGKISEEPEMEDQPKEHFSNFQKRPRRINSEEILKKSNLKKRTKCCCFEFTRKNTDLCKLTDEFFNQLKQISLPMIAQYLESYLIKLEEGLKEKLLHFEKFKYIKKMVKFFLSNRTKEKQLDQIKLADFYDSIIDSKEFCVHDFKNIIYLLEIFSESDMDYLRAFILFLDHEHKSLAKLIFTQLFLDSYNHRFEKLMIHVYKKINGNRLFNLENFSLMHCLELKPNPSLVPNDISSSVKQLLKPRFILLKDRDNHSLFVKYLSPMELFNFYIRREIQTALINFVKKDSLSSLAILKNLEESLINLFKSFSIEKLSNKFILYELLSVFYFIDFSQPEKTAEAILQLLPLLENKLAENALYHFSIAASEIGNLFFKFKLFEPSIKAKLSAFETMKRIREVEMIFPAYHREIDPKAQMFSILSFMMVNQIELERLDPAKAFLDKLNAISFDNPINNLERKILTAFFEFVTENLKSAKATIEAAQKSYEKIAWTDNQKDVFKAIIDKIVLNIAKRTRKQEEIGPELSAYESSIARFYK